MTILSINALYPFNLWSAELAAKAEFMADYAAAAGAKALVMCPLNENRPVPYGTLVESLRNIKSLLVERGLTGLVEHLGFPRSSMRTKAEAISAIREAGGEGTYKLVHDTFHHHLAGEAEFFPEWTGLVHVSGVTDPSLTAATMEYAHRVLVDGADMLGNIAQIKTLIATGYAGPFSFESFAAEVQALDNAEPALQASMDLIRAGLYLGADKRKPGVITDPRFLF